MPWHWGKLEDLAVADEQAHRGMPGERVCLHCGRGCRSGTWMVLVRRLSARLSATLATDIGSKHSRVVRGLIDRHGGAGEQCSGSAVWADDRLHISGASADDRRNLGHG
jgi:hypothetical protein